VWRLAYTMPGTSLWCGTITLTSTPRVAARRSVLRHRRLGMKYALWMKTRVCESETARCKCFSIARRSRKRPMASDITRPVPSAAAGTIASGGCFAGRGRGCVSRRGTPSGLA
jgi:hypothetical protein